MRPTISFLFVFMLMIAPFTPFISAGQETIPVDWWKQEGIQKKLGLTEKQIKEIDSICKEWVTEHATCTKKIQETAGLIQDVVTKDTSEQEINQLLDQMLTERRQITLKKINMRKKVKSLLSKEQVEALLADYPKAFHLSAMWLSAHFRNPERHKGNIIITHGETE
ncbi:Spy/CpxP family protein refolding chaperone [bacterium]|nr:Spy/CpxP family protein refolding chaperone [bacterium]